MANKNNNFLGPVALAKRESRLARDLARTVKARAVRASRALARLSLTLVLKGLGELDFPPARHGQVEKTRRGRVARELAMNS
jgi:hypothetical protein